MPTCETLSHASCASLLQSRTSAPTATRHRARIVWKIEGSLEEQESKTLALAVRSSRPTHPRRPGVIDTRAGRCSSKPPRPQQKKKTTEAALSSKKKPRQRSAVNHITPQPAARRGKSKNCGGLRFQVGKGTGGMTTSETGRATGRAKRHRGRSCTPVMQYVMLNVKHGRRPGRES